METPRIHVPGLGDLNGRYFEAMKEFGFDDPRARSLGGAVWDLMRRATSEVEEVKRRQTLAGDNCFVCYLDVDGFRVRARQDPARLFEEYLKLRRYMLASFFQASSSAQGDYIEIEHTDKLLWPYAFSDSWFFASVDDSEAALRQMSTAAAGIFMRFLEIDLPARGAIAQGQVWWDPQNQTCLGPAIIDAYLTGDELGVFGIALQPGLAEVAPKDVSSGPIAVPVRSKIKSFENKDVRFARL